MQIEELELLFPLYIPPFYIKWKIFFGTYTWLVETILDYESRSYLKVKKKKKKKQ